MKQGMIVEHILSKDWLVFLAETEDGFLACRRKDFEIVYLYPFEVVERK